MPTCHVVFGEAMAILAGDALQALAFEVLAHDAALDVAADVRVAMLRTLAAACGSHGMAGGQAFDLAAVGKTLSAAELERMHVHKTGALIRASVRLGALAAGCRAMRDARCARTLRSCDRPRIPDPRRSSSTSKAAARQLGKTAGKDAADAKPTYPAILGMHGRASALRELTPAALAAVDPLGARLRNRCALARFVAERES